VNQYLKNLLSVTEVLIAKDLQHESAVRIDSDSDYIPYFDIFDADIKDVGMSFASFASTLGELDKKGYLDLSLVVGFGDRITGLPAENGVRSNFCSTFFSHCCLQLEPPHHSISPFLTSVRNTFIN